MDQVKLADVLFHDELLVDGFYFGFTRTYFRVLLRIFATTCPLSGDGKMLSDLSRCCAYRL